MDERLLKVVPGGVHLLCLTNMNQEVVVSTSECFHTVMDCDGSGIKSQNLGDSSNSCRIRDCMLSCSSFVEVLTVDLDPDGISVVCEGCVKAPEIKGVKASTLSSIVRVMTAGLTAIDTVKGCR